ncbi:MAG: SAVED domain-containing protein [Patescibacteria group bacterium]
MAKTTKPNRPSISESVRLRLWVKAAGFCEFCGCGEYLLTDSLTLNSGNYSNIAHIISWTESGPRGDKELSTKLASELSNLMLMCPKHAKLIDTEVNDFPVELLRKWKKEHEDKVRMIMKNYGGEKTHCITLLSMIGGQETSISFDEIKEAIAPKYPANEDGTAIDLRGFSPDEASTINAFTNKITGEVETLMKNGQVTGIPSHISIFGLAPIPLMFLLGYRLGNKIPIDLFQKQRSSQSWKWQEDTSDCFKYQVNVFEGSKKTVALVLSLSGKIQEVEYSKFFQEKPSIYEITFDSPNRDFLITRKRLNDFKNVYQATLSKIRENHGADCEIHVFPAVPVPIAITCGQEVLPKSDPPIYIYDNDCHNGGFKKILQLN